MEPKTRTEVLVVEDDEAIQRGVCDVLAFHGLVPTGVATGEDGLRCGLDSRFVLVILDVMLPGRSGFDVCRELRAARPQLPILMLTARGAEEDVLQGFACGSDDYVTKPFSVAELVARVEALLRRAGGRAPAKPAAFSVGPWRVDPETLRAEGAGQGISLSRLEVDLLALLAREAGRIVSRRMLLREVWGYEAPERIETRTVDVHVSNLRKRLGDAGRQRIETVRGEGYRLLP
ncbi:MAG: response regulator transcription factor [Deltaproteobacteria bacterium]|nr:response regulator transcription factor [Deltaproteobacteria bacterium]